MLRILRIANRPRAISQVRLSRNASQKLVLTLVIGFMATVPLWPGLERLNSARLKSTAGKLPPEPRAVLHQL